VDSLLEVQAELLDFFFPAEKHFRPTDQREVKKLGRPATAPRLVDWNRETEKISTNIEGVEI
jgi:hypothetical protein